MLQTDTPRYDEDDGEDTDESDTEGAEDSDSDVPKQAHRESKAVKRKQWVRNSLRFGDPCVTDSILRTDSFFDVGEPALCPKSTR